jgi:hypothetical protein
MGQAESTAAPQSSALGFKYYGPPVPAATIAQPGAAAPVGGGAAAASPPRQPQPEPQQPQQPQQPQPPPQQQQQPPPPRQEGEGKQGQEEEEAEAVERPLVPNHVLLLPVYTSSDLLDLLCAILPRKGPAFRMAFQALEMPKRLTVVAFSEELALRLADLDLLQATVQGVDPVVYWLDIQDKLQEVALKRLRTRKVSSMPYSVSGDTAPKSHLPPPREDKAGPGEAVQAPGAAAAAAAPGAVLTELGGLATESNPLGLTIVVPRAVPRPFVQARAAMGRPAAAIPSSRIAS